MENAVTQQESPQDAIHPVLKGEKWRPLRGAAETWGTNKCLLEKGRQRALQEGDTTCPKARREEYGIFLGLTACLAYRGRHWETKWRGAQGLGHRKMQKRFPENRGGILSRGIKDSDLYFRKVTLGCKAENTLGKQDCECQDWLGVSWSHQGGNEGAWMERAAAGRERGGDSSLGTGGGSHLTNWIRKLYHLLHDQTPSKSVRATLSHFNRPQAPQCKTF